MARIVCGLFEESTQADAALQGLLGNGFSRSGIDDFPSLPPGQNALHPMGGDVHSYAGARKAGRGAMLGALIGAVLGAMTRMRPGTPRNATREHPVEAAPAGRMIAVLIEPHDSEASAIEQLKRHGAPKVWRAEGTWRNGSWLDFDPRSRLVAV